MPQEKGKNIDASLISTRCFKMLRVQSCKVLTKFSMCMLLLFSYIPLFGQKKLTVPFHLVLFENKTQGSFMYTLEHAEYKDGTHMSSLASIWLPTKIPMEILILETPTIEPRILKVWHEDIDNNLEPGEFEERILKTLKGFGQFYAFRVEFSKIRLKPTSFFVHREFLGPELPLTHSELPHSCAENEWLGLARLHSPQTYQGIVKPLTHIPKIPRRPWFLYGRLVCVQLI
jgi:hypothetical protein